MTKKRFPATIEPRHVYTLAFSSDSSDAVIVPSHRDVVFDGNQWTAATSGTSEDLNSIYYDEPSAIAMCCGDNGTILKSTNGGLTWSDVSPAGLTLSLRSIKKWNDYWFCVGYGNSTTAATILRSDDEGATWDSIDTTTASFLVCIAFSNDRIIFGGWDYPFSTSSALLIYSDDGLTFTRQTISNRAAVYGIAYAKEKFVLCGSGNSALDDLPYLAQSSDGLTWSEITTTHNYSLWSICHNGENWVAAGGYNDKITYSKNLKAWHDAAGFSLSSNYVWRIVSDFQGTMYLFGGQWTGSAGDGYILRSTDNGKNWTVFHTEQGLDLIRKGALIKTRWVIVGLGGFIKYQSIAPSAIIHGSLVDISTTSQEIDPIKANASVGSATLGIIDDNLQLTRLIDFKIRNGYGLRGKRLQHWIGNAGGIWPTDYRLKTTQQMYGSIAWRAGAYYFNSQDVQRNLDQYIFEQKKTTLLSDANWWDVTLSFSTALDTQLVQHDANFSDAPSALVMYIKIENEIIRLTSIGATPSVDKATTTNSGAATAGDTVLNLVSGANFRSNGWGFIDNGGTDMPIRWTGKSGNQLTGVTGINDSVAVGRTVYDSKGRGVLNSRPANHIVDTDRSSENRLKVEEYHYYELNPLKFAYAIITGTFYGTSDTLPPHCQIGLAAIWISTSQWIQYPDLWHISDTSVGPVFRFEGLKKTNAKKFIEEQILFWIDCYMPILNTGELGLDRMTRKLHDAPTTRTITKSQIISIDSFYYATDKVINYATINWNYQPLREEYSRSYPLIEPDSAKAWGSNKEYILNARGIHGSRFSQSLLMHHFESIIDSYASPPLIIGATLDFTCADLEIGEVIRFKVEDIPELMDAAGEFESLDVSMRVDFVHVGKSTVKVKLFGATGEASALVSTSNTVMADTYYGSAGGGTNIASVTTGSWSAGVGSTWTITANHTFTGNASMNNAAAKFYLDGDLVIDNNVTITLVNNVQLRAKSFTNNGFVDAVGGGMPATAGGNAGGVGICKSGGGLHLNGDVTPRFFQNIDGILTAAPNFSTPVPFLKAPTTTTLEGIPDDLRGTGGASGGDVTEGPNSSLPYIAGAPYPLSGGAGGAGGAGFCIITRSFSQGANGRIDVSGEDGQPGEYSIYWDDPAPNANHCRLAAGAGAGGSPGGFMLILDGGLSTVTDLDQVDAYQGDSPLPVNPWSYGHVLGRYTLALAWITPDNHTYISPGIGIERINRADSMRRVSYIPAIETIEEDTSDEAALPTAINITPGSNENINVNWFFAEISVSAPTDSNFAGALIYWSQSNALNARWTEAGTVSATVEILLPLPLNSGTHYFRAHSISNSGVISTDYIEGEYTAPTSFDTIIPDGSTITGTAVASGSAADETLVPNGFFDFPLSGTWRLIQPYGTEPTTLPTIEYDATEESNYLKLPNNATNYGYGSKTFRLIPGSRYRALVRMEHSGTGDEDGLYIYVNWRKQYADLITVGGGPAPRDGYISWLTGTQAIVPDSWDSFSFDFVVPAGANWGSLAFWNGTQSSVDFHIGFADLVPWAGLSFWDAQIPGGSSYKSGNIYFDSNVGEIGEKGLLVTILTSSRFHEDYVELVAEGTLDTLNTGFAFYRNNLLGLDAPAWSKNRFLLFICQENSQVTNQEIYIGTGNPNNQAYNQLSIKCAGSSMYARVCNGTSCTVSSAFSGVTWGSGNTFKIEIRFYAGSKCEFYVDDVLKATITATLPTDAVTVYRNWYFRGFTYNNGAISGAGGGALVGDFRFLQTE